MKLHFTETMSGELSACPKHGRSHPFQFTVTVMVPGIKNWLLGQALPMSGRATLEGHANNVDFSGTLRIGLPFKSELEYSGEFDSPSGERYRFFGKKRVSLLRFPSTMSTLFGEVYQDGALLGPATLYFRWRDLPAFLKSFIS